jgi:hypothetical protein
MAKTAFYAMSSMVYVKPKTEDGSKSGGRMIMPLQE